MQRDPVTEAMLHTERRMIHYGFEPTREQLYEWLTSENNGMTADRKTLLLGAYEQGKTYDKLLAMLDMKQELPSWYLAIDILIDIHFPDSFI